MWLSPSRRIKLAFPPATEMSSVPEPNVVSVYLRRGSRRHDASDAPTVPLAVWFSPIDGKAEHSVPGSAVNAAPHRVPAYALPRAAVDDASGAAGRGSLLRPHAGSSVGGCTVRTAFTAEPGTLCSAFPSIGLNQTASGTVGASGCVMPDGSPYEAYTLTTFGSGTLDISVAGGNASLILRDGDSHILASDPAHVTAPVDDDSEYQVVVAGAGGADPAGSAYQITTGFQPNDGETCRAAKVLDPGGDSDSNAITADSCSRHHRRQRRSILLQLLQLHAGRRSGLVSASAVSGDFTATVNLPDAAGNMLAYGFRRRRHRCAQYDVMLQWLRLPPRGQLSPCRFSATSHPAAITR